MTARSRRPNDALRTLIEEAGWTNHGFAAAVNRVGAEAGVTLHYDRTTVSHWLAGSRPRPPVRGIIAEAFARRLGRPVLVADAGFGDTSTAATPVPGEDATAALLALTKADLDPVRRGVLRGQPYQLDWTVTSDRAAGDAHRPSAPPGSGDLEAVRTMTTAFTQAYEMFGGGHARSALTAYLAADLPARLYTRTAAKRELLAEAAILTHLNGVMCFDNLHHGLAQRYYRVARRLAAQANDATAQATVLRAMSTQACFLGHHRYAIRMAEHAVAEAAAGTSPATRAVALGQAAVAHAAAGNHRTAMACLHEAERRVARATAPIAADDLADLADATGQVLAALGELRDAEKQFRDALRLLPAHARVPRMLTLHRLAVVQLRRGRLEAACTSWQHFLVDYPAVCSAQVGAAATAVRGRLRPHSGNPTVRRTLNLFRGAVDPRPRTRWPAGVPLARTDPDKDPTTSDASPQPSGH